MMVLSAFGKGVMLTRGTVNTSFRQVLVPKTHEILHVEEPTINRVWGLLLLMIQILHDIMYTILPWSCPAQRPGPPPDPWSQDMAIEAMVNIFGGP